jgi:hypothetical protein
MKQCPEITERKARTILLPGVGWTARKNPAVAEVFFSLTPLIELIRWDEKAGLQRDAIRSHETTRSRRKKETGNEEE